MAATHIDFIEVENNVLLAIGLVIYINVDAVRINVTAITRARGKGIATAYIDATGDINSQGWRLSRGIILAVIKFNFTTFTAVAIYRLAAASPTFKVGSAIDATAIAIKLYIIGITTISAGASASISTVEGDGAADLSVNIIVGF